MSVSYLLLQVRDAEDPMRTQEVDCFADALRCNRSSIATHDLLAGPATVEQLRSVDIVLVGGSGDYSVVTGGPWLAGALATMRRLVDEDIPTFASCWGFQAICLALGGRVVTNLALAEIGTHELQTTSLAKDDPVFAELPSPFLAQMGHQDIVTDLPPQAELLASSSLVKNQAIRIKRKRIYATQFHPELSKDCLVQRLVTYPQYVELVAKVPIEQFVETCLPADASQQLLPRFVQWVL